MKSESIQTVPATVTIPESKKVNSTKVGLHSTLRVRNETRKKILAELAKVNRKVFGRRVRVDQLLEVLLSLLTQDHIKKMQTDSLSNSDRLEMRYREHVKKFGAISKDEFLGLLLASEGGKSEENSAPHSGAKTGS